MRGDERERTGQHMRCTLPHSYSGDVEGVNPPLPRLPAHPPAGLFACLLLYSLHASSHASLLASTLASAGVLALPIRQGSHHDVACEWVGMKWRWGQGRMRSVDSPRVWGLRATRICALDSWHWRLTT